MDKRISVLYASPHALDRTVNSGTSHQLRACLRREFPSCQTLAPLPQAISPTDRLLERLGRRRLLPWQPLPYHTWRNARAMAAAVNARISAGEPSVIVLPTSIPAAEIRGDVPLVVYSDATIAAMVGYYEDYGRVRAASVREALSVERAALRRCARICMASDWARQSVIRDYGVAPELVQVLPRGANLDPGFTEQELAVHVSARSARDLRLLHVGRDFRRKGGPLVLDTLRLLRQRGVRASLTVIGSEPKVPAALRPWVTVLGRLSLDRAADRSRMDEAFRAATLLFVPSRAEAMGIMYCDGFAYGLPAIARDTGGVSTVVRNGETGCLLPEGATSADYAEVVASLLATPGSYARLARGAFAFYRGQGNWRAVGRALRATLLEAVASGGEGWG